MSLPAPETPATLSAPVDIAEVAANNVLAPIEITELSVIPVATPVEITEAAVIDLIARYYRVVS